MKVDIPWNKETLPNAQTLQSYYSSVDVNFFTYVKTKQFQIFN